MSRVGMCELKEASIAELINRPAESLTSAERASLAPTQAKRHIAMMNNKIQKIRKAARDQELRQHPRFVHEAPIIGGRRLLSGIWNKNIHPDMKLDKSAARRRLVSGLKHAGKLGAVGVVGGGLVSLSSLANNMEESCASITQRAKFIEALSEERRRRVRRSQFVAPDRSREGHSDRGLYPIFDVKSAKAAVRLAGKHPELKERIYRRAARYGVGPYANKE